jgi:hypothetical protein
VVVEEEEPEKRIEKEELKRKRNNGEHIGKRTREKQLQRIINEEPINKYFIKYFII